MAKLQEELTQQKLITDTISEENVKTKQELARVQAQVEMMMQGIVERDKQYFERRYHAR